MKKTLLFYRISFLKLLAFERLEAFLKTKSLFTLLLKKDFIELNEKTLLFYRISFLKLPAFERLEAFRKTKSLSYHWQKGIL